MMARARSTWSSAVAVTPICLLYTRVRQPFQPRDVLYRDFTASLLPEIRMAKTNEFPNIVILCYTFYYYYHTVHHPFHYKTCICIVIINIISRSLAAAVVCAFSFLRATRKIYTSWDTSMMLPCSPTLPLLRHDYDLLRRLNNHEHIMKTNQHVKIYKGILLIIRKYKFMSPIIYNHWRIHIATWPIIGVHIRKVYFTIYNTYIPIYIT